MVAVIPSDSAIKKRIETKKKCCSDSPFFCDSFEWKREVKSLFIGTLNGLLAQEFVAFGLKASEASPSGLDRHGPAYTLELEWDGGQLYKGLKIQIDLSIAVKINSHSSTMAVDFESGAGKVVKSLLDASPAYYLAVSGYTVYDVPPSNLFLNLEETQEVRILSQSDYLLRISQSCLEQSLFRDHFGPDGGPSVCLRILKVLRDMTRTFDKFWLFPGLTFYCKNGIDQTAWEFITAESVSNNWQSVQHSKEDGGPEPYSTRWISSYILRVLKVLRDMTRLLHRGGFYLYLKFNCKNLIDETAWEFITAESVSSNWQRAQQWNSGEVDSEPDSTRWISSYALKTLVLFEWSENPEGELWTGNNLSQRLVNIVTCLLHILKCNEGLRSFWYTDYNVLPDAFVPPEAINRATIILRFLLSLDNKINEYSFEQCIQNYTTLMTVVSQKQEVTRFLHHALKKLFCDKMKKVLRESVGERKKKTFTHIPKLLRGDIFSDFAPESRVFIGFYIQALLNKIAPEEELILSYYSEYDKESVFVFETEILTSEEAKGIVKRARELFREIARERMNTLDTDLPDYSLWSQDFKPDEMANLLKLLCENFKKDLEILWNKIRNLREEVRTRGENGVET